MLHYDANISVVTGIAWDHVNIYKTYNDYKEIFDTYLRQKSETDLIYFDQSDSDLLDLVLENKYACSREGYLPLVTNKKGEVVWDKESYPIEVFGQHNLKNLNAARLVCNQIDISTEEFLSSISDFTGAAKRLEIIYDSQDKIIYKDFAHAPSKAKATAEAVRSKHPRATINGILELHTFSSLTMSFIEHYKNCLDSLDEVKVFYDPHALEMKGLPALDSSKIWKAFDHPNLEVMSASAALGEYLAAVSNSTDEVLLIMSSGNLGGQDIMSYIKG